MSKNWVDEFFENIHESADKFGKIIAPIIAIAILAMAIDIFVGILLFGTQTVPGFEGVEGKITAGWIWLAIAFVASAIWMCAEVKCIGAIIPATLSVIIGFILSYTISIASDVAGKNTAIVALVVLVLSFGIVLPNSGEVGNRGHRNIGLSISTLSLIAFPVWWMNSFVIFCKENPLVIEMLKHL